MPAEPGDPTDPGEWLRRARRNLNPARVGRLGDVLLADLCFEAQQAAEKAIKAVLVARSIRFPKTHVISEASSTSKNAMLPTVGPVEA